MLDALPLEQRQPALNVLLPVELSLRQQAGETLERAVLEATYPEAGDWLDQLLEDAVTIRVPGSGGPWALPNSWPQTTSTMTAGGGRPEDYSFVGGSLEPPKQVGHYDILEEIGRGGMGVVYKALDRKLKRIVALKMMLSGAFADVAARSRFRREAEALAQVQHPHLVQVYDVGEDQGHAYVVFEFIDGINLAAFARRRPMDPRLAATLVEKVARAVQAAHDRGIIHRDLKPGNILLGLPSHSGLGPRPSGSGRSLNPFTLVPKLTDFGLAKRLDRQTAATTAGQVLGTAQYMAPEQAVGDSSRVGPTADVYGLGAVLYELLTGLPPISGENLIELMMHVQGRDPAAPSQFAPSLPRDLETICLKCLEKEPGRRYPSAAALADELARFLRREPIAARPVSSLEKAWRWCRRNPIVASLTAALVFSLATLALVFGWQWQEAQVVNRELADRNEQLAAARDEAQQARQAAITQRDDLRRQNATETFLRGLEAAEAGDATLGLFLMARSLELAPPEWSDFQRVVRVNLAEWSRYVPEVLGPAAPGPLRFWSVPAAGGHAWIWSEEREEIVPIRLDSGQPVGPPLAMPANSRPIGASSNSRWLAIGLAAPARVEVWDLELRTRHAVVEHAPPIRRTAIRDDGQRLTTLDADGRLRIWELPGGRLLAGPVPLIPRMNRDFSLEYGPQGDLLLRAAGIGLILDGDKGLPRSPAQASLALAFHPQSPRVLVERHGTEAEVAGHLVLINSANGQLINEYNLPIGLQPHTAKFSGGGDVLAAAAHNDLVTFWDPGEGRAIWAPLRGCEVSYAIFDAAFEFGLSRFQRFRLPRPISRLGSPPIVGAVPSRRRFSHQRQMVHLGAGARWAATVRKSTADQPLAVRLLDPEAGMPYGRPLLVAGDLVRGLASSNDGKRLAVATYHYGVFAGWVNVCDTRTGLPLLPPLEHTNYIGALAFSPDGSRLAVSDFNRQILIWNLTSGQLERAPLLEAEIVTAMAWSPDGRTLAVGTGLDYSRQPFIRLWDVTLGLPRSAPLPVRSQMDSLEYAADGESILGTNLDSVVVIHASTGMKRYPELTVPTLNVLTVSPAGDWFALGTGEGSVYLHRLSSGELVGKLVCRQAVYSLAFTPDGKSLAVGCQDGAVRLWDLATRLPLGAPRVQSTSITALAFHLQTNTLVAASSDGCVRSWALPPPPADSDRLRQRLEVLTGVQFDETELLVIEPEAWNTRWAGLAKQTQVKPLAARLPDFDWHELRARDAEDGNEEWAACWHLNRLLAARPDDPHLLLRRARGHVSQGDLVQAEADCRRAEQLFVAKGDKSGQGVAAWHFDRALSLWAGGRPNQALWHANLLITHWPTAQAHWLRADLNRTLGFAAAAANDEERALALGLPSHLAFELAVRRAEAGDWTGAGDVCQATLPRSRPPVHLRTKVASILAKTGRAEAIPPLMDDLIGIMETQATGAWVRQQVWAFIAHDWPRPLLERMLARVEAVKPPAAEPLRGAYEATAGALQIRLGKRQEGAARIRAALNDRDDSSRATLLAMLAIAALEDGNAAGARLLLNEARSALPAQSSIWDQEVTRLLLGEVERGLGGK